MLVLVLSVNKVLACIGVLGLVLPLVGSLPFVEGSALLLDPTDSRMSVVCCIWVSVMLFTYPWDSLKEVSKW
jgi:hypothetical protein